MERALGNMLIGLTEILDGLVRILSLGQLHANLSYKTVASVRASEVRNEIERRKRTPNDNTA